MIIAGGGSLSVRDEIFKLDPITKTWTLEGRMKEARSGHSVSEVDYSDIAQFCTENKKGMWKLFSNDDIYLDKRQFLYYWL